MREPAFATTDSGQPRVALAATLASGPGFEGLPITLADSDRASRLPLHHRDLFDRVLVAQATRLEAVIVSRDQAFAPYEVDFLSA